MPRDFSTESLSHDPIHGYIPFVSTIGLPTGETSEQDIIDHPWVQRMRHIHQLQTAHFVFPSAEHMRFQHILGAMHLASRAIDLWYESLAQSCPNTPSKAYVESLVRMAALLHDIGHGPFGHFFDDNYLAQYNLTHEDIGAHIIQNVLGDALQGIRRNPSGVLKPLEILDPRQIAWLIKRPQNNQTEGHPDWLRKLRAMFSGIYTVDNMDFVLRDAYMSGYNTKAFDLWRLLHYSFFTPQGLTIHVRGLPTLINFVETRANLFRTIYFHRTVRAFDIAIEDVFTDTMKHFFPGNPLEHLDDYLLLTESSFLVDVSRFPRSSDPRVQELGRKWARILNREFTWHMACERVLNFHSANAERMTIFAETELVEKRVRQYLPQDLKEIPLRCDSRKHYHRPRGRLPVGGQNYLLDSAHGGPVELHDDELFRQLPMSFLIFRIYSHDQRYDEPLNAALNQVLGDASDDKTNM